MEPFLATLCEQLRSPQPPGPALDSALARLSRILAGLASALEIEYIGPFVGLGAGHQAFCLAVRAHTEAFGVYSWGVRVCSAQAHAGLRASWELARVARLRKPVLVQALPAFLSGYYEAVVAAGQDETLSGRRLRELAQALQAVS